LDVHFEAHVVPRRSLEDTAQLSPVVGLVLVDPEGDPCQRGAGPRVLSIGSRHVQIPTPNPPALRTVVASPRCPDGWNSAIPLSSRLRGRPVNALAICSARAPNAPSAAARSVPAASLCPCQSSGRKPSTISRVRRPTASRYSRTAPTSI